MIESTSLSERTVSESACSINTLHTPHRNNLEWSSPQQLKGARGFPFLGLFPLAVTVILFASGQADLTIVLFIHPNVSEYWYHSSMLYNTS